MNTFREGRAYVGKPFMWTRVISDSMCKAVDRGMVMSDIKLLEKSGGKSGEWKAG